MSEKSFILVKRIAILSSIIFAVLTTMTVAIIYFYPFLLAIVFSLVFLPFVNYLENYWQWKRSVATFSVIGSFILLLMTLMTFIVAEMVQGLSFLSKVLPSYIEELTTTIQQWINTSLFPLIAEISQFTSGLERESGMAFDQSIDQILSEGSMQIGNIVHTVLSQLQEFFIAFPHALTMILFSLLASFFITKDWPQIMIWINTHLPDRLTYVSGRIFKEWKAALGHYLMAQLILVLITAFIVFAGLIILNVNYAFTTALLIAAVDILPYVGTGIVFIPWIIYSFLNANWYMAIGLSILYGIVTIQRQLSEPKILAHHMGMPTLMLLFTVFACYQVFGFAGILFGPFILIIIQSLKNARVVDEIRHYLFR
ncbi:sporulation integral membrane protein YtvI [Salipaludibacillus sp. LMS25]|jgi:sporulation integral membrane protein YtvI|uniref:sporulation integral membrane protein YtvI n=1 Tax=Salipaludibacillus sp. LMS25 TaxID=2924031 RepID=UPI0020D12A36|nr:sporulation integral membrane protein YtvI [Salipaludibacillus sp. LMS25]UTR15583.1 sporulation integral membrane protein YtvI [Salipaludibacillus sp. LMS25]